MREPNVTPSGAPKPPKNSTVALLLGTIADTTWRMFIPIIGLLLAGLWLDKKYDTLPWATILLTLIGIAIATQLVRKQLKNVNKN